MKKSIPCFKIEKKSTYSPRQRALCSRQSALCSSRVRSALDETEAMALKPWLVPWPRPWPQGHALNAMTSTPWLQGRVKAMASRPWLQGHGFKVTRGSVIFNYMFSDIFISKNHLKMTQNFRQFAALADHWNFRRSHDLSYDDNFTYWRSPHGRNLNPSPLFNVGMLNESFSLKETRFSSYHACHVESKRSHVDIFQRWTGAGVDSMKKFM